MADGNRFNPIQTWFRRLRHFLRTDFGCPGAELYRTIRPWHGDGRHCDKDHASPLHVELVGHLRSNIVIRPAWYGPRSSIVTVAVLPLLRLVTVAVVPSGKVVLAATKAATTPVRSAVACLKR
jgi:hypothetical protein